MPFYDTRFAYPELMHFMEVKKQAVPLLIYGSIRRGGQA